jgi:subtilisin family serine protease
VAVIDTGYRPHADLSGQILQGYDFISTTTIANDGGGRDSDASDPGDWTPAGSCGTGVPAADQHSSWHGTHVAGTIAAKTSNGLGVAASPTTRRSSRRACWAVRRLYVRHRRRHGLGLWRRRDRRAGQCE